MPRKLVVSRACGRVLCPALPRIDAGVKCRHCTNSGGMDVNTKVMLGTSLNGRIRLAVYPVLHFNPNPNRNRESFPVLIRLNGHCFKSLFVATLLCIILNRISYVYIQSFNLQESLLADMTNP